MEAGPSCVSGQETNSEPARPSVDELASAQDAATSRGGERLRLRLDIAYDGTDFVGWAVQPGRRSVAGVIGAALKTLLRQQVPMVVAGRTDSGVHATGQVAHIDTNAKAVIAVAPRSLEPSLAAGLHGLLRRLAGMLPADIRVMRITPAPPGFDARFSAIRRHYRYRIATAEWGANPVCRTDILDRPRPLDTQAMARAAAGLLGLHDFAAFCKPREGATTIRDLQQLTVRTDGTDVIIDVAADAFCHSMVRALVGALLAVGDGRQDPQFPARLLAAQQRSAQVHTAPAKGLTLIAVDYPDDDELAARAQQTRALRV